MTTLARIGFEADTSGLTKAQRELDKTARHGEQAERKLDRTIANTNKSFSSLKTSIGLVGTALTALGAASLTRDVVKYSDSWKGVTSQLRQVTDSEKELLAVRRLVLETAKETRSDLEATTRLYASLDRATTSLGVSTEKQIEITKTINNLFLSSGASAQDASNAIRQLVQGLEAGALRGDEFNSVAENAPRILDALAKSTGMARGQLREFAATGGITAKVLVKALDEYSEAAQKMANQTEMTFGQSMEIASTNITEFVGGLDSINSVVGSFGAGIVDLTANMDAIGDAVENSAILIGVTLTAAYTKSAAAAISSSKAIAAANIEVTKSEQAKALSTLHSAQQSQLAAKRSLEVAANSTLRAGAITRLAKANGVLIASELSAAAATSKYNSAVKSATLSTRALNLVTSSLLSPWGLLAAALGTAAISYKLAADEAENLNKEQKKEVQTVELLIARYEKFSAGLLGSKYVEAQKKAIEADKEKARIQKELIRLNSDEEVAAAAINRTNKQRKEKIQELEESLVSLGTEQKKYSDILTAIGKVFESTIPQAENMNLRIKDGKEVSEELNKSLSKLANDSLVNSAKGIENMLVNLEMQRQELKMTADEFEVYKAKIDALNSRGTPEMVSEIVRQVKELQKLRNEIERTEKFDKNLEDLIGKTNEFSDAWSTTGNVIIDAFGGAADQIASFARQMEGINSLQDEFNKKREEAISLGKDTTQIDKELASLNEKSTTAQISAIGKLAGMTSSMFKENSKERKALHALEMGFAVAEMAIAAEKAVVSAVGAVANQGQGDPYTAFARIASMTAIMAGVLGAAGIAFSASGGGSAPRATNDGTGTVLGSDEASGSIGNSLESFEDIELDQLAELRGIRDSLVSLSSGIEQLARSFAIGGIGEFTGDLGDKTFLDTAAGGFLRKMSGVGLGLDLIGLGSVADAIFGAFSSTKKKIVDQGITFISQTLGEVLSSGIIGAQAFFDVETTKKKLFGLSKKVKVSTETQDIDNAILEQMGSIFGFIGESVIGAAKSLGFETVTIIKKTVTNDFLEIDLSGVDIGNIKDMIRIGFDTVFEEVELSLEDAINSFNLNIGDISFEGLSGKEINEKLQAVFSQQSDLIAEFLIPAIKDYQQIGEGSFETLQRVAMEQAVFNDSVANMGFNLSELSNIMKIDVAQSIISLVGGLDEFKDASSEYIDTFFSEQEKFDILTNSLTDVFEQLGQPLSGTREEFRSLVESLDLTTEEGQKTFATLMRLVPSMDAYLTELEKQGEVVENLKGVLSESMVDIERAVDAEKSLAAERLNTASATHKAAVEAISQQKSLLESQHGILTDNLSFAEQQLRSAFDVEKSGIQEAAAARINGLNQEKSIISASMSRMISLANRMNQAAGNSITVQDALNAARKGDFSLAEQLNVSALSDKGFSSSEELAFSQARQNAQVREIGSLAGGKASEQERMIASLDAQTISARASADNQISKLDDQLMALLGIDTSIPSIEDAINLYKEAQLDLDELNYSEELQKLDDQLALAQEQLDLAQQEYNDEIERLDGILESSEAQINALLEIDTSVKSVVDAVNDLNEIIRQQQQAIPSTPLIKVPIEDPLMDDNGRNERDMVNKAMMESARANKETADILSKIYRGEINVRQVN